MSIRQLTTDQPRPKRQPPTQPRSIARLAGEQQRKRLRQIVVVFLVVGLACVFASTARGQGAYRKVPLKKAFNNDKVVRRAVSDTKKFATGGPRNGYVDQYFTNYVPAILTDPAHITKVSEVMEDYVDILNKAQRSGRNTRAVQEQVFRMMNGIAANNFMPSARISAINVLSLLDSAPANTSNKTPPVPLAATLPVLVGLYQDEANVDGVRAAALHGIHRHVNYGFRNLSDEQKAGLSEMMNQLLDSKPPAGRSAEAHAYLQRFAVDINDKLRKQGDTALGQKLISISTEESIPSMIALHSARRAGEMGKELKGKVSDPSGVLNSWSRRTLNVMQAELDRLKALDRAEPAGGQPPNPDNLGSGGGGTGSSGGSRPKKKSAGGLGALGSSSSSSRSSSAVEPPGFGQGGGGLGALGGPTNERGRGRKKVRKREPTPGENQPPEVVGSRRKLNYALQHLQIAVTGSPARGLPAKGTGGLMAMVEGDVVREIERWVDDMEDRLQEINDEELTTRADFVEMLETQIDLLQEEVGEAPAADAADPASDQPPPPNPDAADPDELAGP